MFISILFINMFLNKPFILASSSKSRFNILKKSGIPFSVVKPKCNEDYIKAKLKKINTKPKNIAKALSLEKAMSVSCLKKNYLVVGCDTVIVFENKLIDKAKTAEEAKKKLIKLSGKDHKIISAVTVCLNSKSVWSHQESTTITMKKLNPKQINNYLKRAGKQILSSVGCYQIENMGPQIIKNIKGDFFNVMGLPLFSLLDYIESKK